MQISKKASDNDVQVAGQKTSCSDETTARTAIAHTSEGLYFAKGKSKHKFTYYWGRTADALNSQSIHRPYNR